MQIKFLCPSVSLSVRLSRRCMILIPLPTWLCFAFLLCISVVFAVARCLSVCQRWCIVSTRLKISSNFFLGLVAHHSRFFLHPSAGTQFQGGDAKYKVVGKLCDFRLESLSISEMVRYRGEMSYYQKDIWLVQIWFTIWIQDCVTEFLQYRHLTSRHLSTAKSVLARCVGRVKVSLTKCSVLAGCSGTERLWTSCCDIQTSFDSKVRACALRRAGKS